jgi:nucleoside-diphosphate-sugar epimerase
MSSQQTKIAILGCGWLGLPLAKELVNQGYHVNGSTTDGSKLSEITNIGAKAYVVWLEPDLNADYDDSFLDCDVLIMNFPPIRRVDIVDYHQKQFAALIPKIRVSNVKKILMVSSTSVYPSTDKILVETDAQNPDKGSGQALLIVEEMLQNLENIETTIVRFGGLIGYDRNPARFLFLKDDLKDGSIPVNLIHRDDCIAIISEIIKQQKWGTVYNACCDEHPTRRAFYSEAARKSGFAEPIFADNENQSHYKIIDNSKLKRELGYRFKYKSPLDCL